MLTPTRVLHAKSWASTLKLPRSAFPPRPTNLATYLKRCTDDLYAWQGSHRAAATTFVLHDGPPYANGSLHVGHALNKILKDVICRFHLGQGKKVQYIPGWDCHGLPIEIKALQAQQEKGAKGVLGPVKIREAARELAARTVEEQKAGFRHWGVMGDWDNAYRTMDPGFEMRQLEVFKSLVGKGLIYRQNKPVYWSPSSGTALAEAELEYDENHTSTSAFVKFPVSDVTSETLKEKILAATETDLSSLYAVIWTTTPWTLPANKAIAVHPEMEYCIVQPSDPLSKDAPAAPLPETDFYLVAKSRVEHLEERAGCSFRVVLDSILGSELAGAVHYANPLCGLDLTTRSPIIAANYVTDTSGTGLVHNAPGHGMEDYLVCMEHGLEPFAPVDDNGRFTAEAMPFDPGYLEGKLVQKEGTSAVLDFLRGSGKDTNYIIAVHKLTHKYPIDWRTKKPVITRATEQWFANVDDIKAAALEALEDVNFVPARGRVRLESFVSGRSQWCISRQRAWGVPIPALYRIESGTDERHNQGVKRIAKEAVMTVESINHIMKVIQERGIDAWWSDPIDDPAWVLPGLEGTYIRGRDTMDVWFDSGTSWTLLEPRGDQPVADVYLEGSDQHRGWFQSSLLTHIASQTAAKNILRNDVAPSPRPKAPFKNLLTHGFTLDQDGRKMSKSIGNVISPDEIMNGTLLPPLKLKKKSGKNQKQQPNGQGADKPTYDAMGPDALRLWVASSDYTGDVVIGQTVLQGINTALQKYRVTFKWLLGVLSDYSPSSDSSTPKRLSDVIALRQLSQTAQTVHSYYNTFAPYQAIGALNRYVNTNLSSFYFETLKDRVYTGTPVDRHAAQSVAHEIFQEMCMMLGPVTPVLVEEVWEHAPEWLKESQQHPARRVWQPFRFDVGSEAEIEKLDQKTEVVMKVFDKIKVAQEKAREQKLIGSGLECDVVVFLPEQAPQVVKEVLSTDMHEDLSNLFVVSGCSVATEWSGPKELEDGKWVFEEPWEVTLAGEKVVGKVVIKPAEGGKCARCWRYLAEEDHELCGRCEDVVKDL